jgi:carbon storage regulator
MLVLSRKVGEVCVIGDNISVKVLRIVGNQVRLGISAPHEVRVFRKEISDRVPAKEGKAVLDLPVDGNGLPIDQLISVQ